MRKVIIKRIISIAIWLVFIAVFVISLGFSKTELNKMKCKSINVQIVDTTGNSFVEPNDIIEFLNQKNYKIVGNYIKGFPLNKIENDINNYPSVKSTEVFTTLDGILHIVIVQREPILRIINYDCTSYYIDCDGALFPLSEKYTARVLAANGKINEPYNLRYTKDIAKTEAKDELGRKFIVDDLFILAKFIRTDKFLDAFIEQIFINNNDEIELVPKVGTFTILLGDIQNLEEKFTNLKALILIGLPREGWNKYETINIKYKNQVVCTKINENE